MNDKEYRKKLINLFVGYVKTNNINSQIAMAGLVDYMFIDFNGEGFDRNADKTKFYDEVDEALKLSNLPVLSLEVRNQETVYPH